MEELFQEIRENCSRSIWSKAVELTRSAIIVGESADAEHAVLRVTPPGAIVGRTVTLYLQDTEWSCDCGGEEDPCEHVAAAAIALRQARKDGKDLPEAPSSIARIRYLFRREGGALSFGRAFVQGETVTPFEATLSAIQSGRIEGPPFVAGPADLTVDHILGMRLSGWLPREVISQIIDALADGPDARLDGAPIKVAKDRAEPHAVLEDQGDGLRLTLAGDPRVTEVFSNGAALCGDTLRVTKEPRLDARELSEYRGGKFFGPEQKVELLTKIVPALKERIEVEFHTRKMPRASRALPRLEIRTERAGEALSVLPLIVYGDPAVARVDAGKLVLLGDEMPARDEEGEERLVRRLQSVNLVPGHREVFEGDQAVAFVAKLQGLDREVKGEAHQRFFVAPGIVPLLSVKGDTFDLSFESAQGGIKRHAEAGAVLRAWKTGASLVPLLEGGFAPLPVDWLSKFGNRIADLLAAKGDRETLPASALPDLARLCEALEKPPPPGFQKLQPLFQDFAGLPESPLPSDLKAELRHYQATGVRWLKFCHRAGLGALLADDMGLGKTLQALCALELPALVVAPTSVVFNWAAEIARFRPSLKVCLYHGPQRVLDPSADVTLTSYALLRLDQDALVAAREWGTVLLDEAQAIKNPDSQVARAAYRVRAKWRVAMTGTPVENRLEELWSQFHFLNPGLLGGRGDFDERYGKPIAAGEAGSAARLRERIRPFVLRRLKREVAPELPPRIEVVERVELGEDERTLYQALYAATREEVVGRLKEGGNVLAALEALLRLRQACCHPALVPGQKADSSAKVDQLLELLDEAASDGHKALVFSQWTSLLDLIEPKLEAAKLPFVRLDGSTLDRAGVVARFQADDGPPVMLVSLKAGGAGLNLTAADHVFLVDPWWNPAVEDQAADRAHRIGQERPVMVHRMVALGTVEERILALQAEKRAIAEAALSGSDRAASLSRDDLIALLE
ncbi:MAG TPA: DEAD/DEAH box helicase [Myxococcales bacterium]|jgi:hypothetical protein